MVDCRELLEPGKSGLYRMVNAEKRPDVEQEALWRLWLSGDGCGLGDLGPSVELLYYIHMVTQ